jgi:hypothetical protein
MPITKKDVLAVLADPVLARMNFSVGDIFIKIREYNNVAEYIRDDDITIKPGGKDKIAFYDGHDNTLMPQNGNAPLDLADRALILHECTHAIPDVNELEVRKQDNEVAGFLAQLTYMELSSPSPPLPHGPLRGASPMGKLVIALRTVIQNYGLDQPRGFGISIRELDIWKLATDVRRLPSHSDVKPTDFGKPADLGVPVKNNQMRALRAALTRARRPRRAYTPSPRIEIF